jgi:thiol-disulfide isomerase/thioredoxin
VAELAAGSIAPAAELPSAAGDAESVVAIPGAATKTLLAFFKSSCPTCKWALPWIQRLHESARDAGLRVVAVAEDDSSVARALVEELSLTFPVGVESEPWALSEAYGLSTVPTFFLVDEGGVVEMASPGFSRDDLLECARRAAEAAGVPAPKPFPEDLPAFRPG